MKYDCYIKKDKKLKQTSKENNYVSFTLVKFQFALNNFGKQ